MLADEVLDIDKAIETGFSQRMRARAGQTAAVKPQQNHMPKNLPENLPESRKKEPAGMVKLRIPADMNENMTLEEIKTNLKRHKGAFEVLIYLPSGKTFRTEESLWVEPSEALRKQMTAILRAENVKM